MDGTAAILTQGLFATSNAKTAHGLVRGPSRFRIVALIDDVGAGQDAGVLLDGSHRGIPTFRSLEALIESGTKPQWCVIGIATAGGVLPDALRPTLERALELGISVANGLHDLLGDDTRFTAAAARGGATILDIRRPKRPRDLHFWSGAVQTVRAARLAVLGTDCALGKRTTCQVLAAACRQKGIATEMVYTGQTGWLQGSPFGFVLDATPNDFVAGELEHAIVQCDQQRRPDLILLEGQSALRNPSGPCGAELLLAGGARGVILQHAPARQFFEGQEALGNEIPPLRSEIALIGMYGARVLAVALNHEHLDGERLDRVKADIEQQTGLPACYPLLEGADRLVAAVQPYLAGERS